MCFLYTHVFLMPNVWVFFPQSHPMSHSQAPTSCPIIQSRSYYLKLAQHRLRGQSWKTILHFRQQFQVPGFCLYFCPTRYRLWVWTVPGAGSTFAITTHRTQVNIYLHLPMYYKRYDKKYWWIVRWRGK